MKVILVSAVALIDRDGRVLITQRPKGKNMEGLWEFPGGKIKKNETSEDALIREINEELSINISNYNELISYSFNYSDLGKTVFINFYLIKNFTGKILNNFHNQLKWIEIKDIREYDFLEGDQLIIQKLINNEFKLY